MKHWEEEGVWLNAWRRLRDALDAEDLLKRDKTFLDGSFAPTKKGSDALGKTKRDIELIAPYRKNNKERKYKDGRKLRRYKRRWKIELTNAWLGQFRRLLVRHERFLTTYQAFFYIACL